MRTAQAFFRHRLTGVLELPQACSPLTGGKFFAEPQRGDSPSADGRTLRHPPRGAKRKGHLRFPFLFELLPFPWRVWRRLPTCDRCEKRERQRIFSTVGEHSVLPCRDIFAVSDSVLLHRWFHIRRARHGSAAQFFSALLQTGSTRINAAERLHSQVPCVTTC